MVILRTPDLRLRGAHREDGVHDMVTGDDVDDRLRCRRELRKLAASVRQDQGLRHLEAFDPAGIGMHQGRLDDCRPDDRNVYVPTDIGYHPLAECLGEGVGIGPAKRACSLGAGLHEFGLDPFEAATLGVGCGRQETGLPVLALCLLPQLRELCRGA